MKKILLNPFDNFSERPLILFGIAATILLSMTSAYFNARYDGVIDLHFSKPTFVLNTLTDNALNVVILSLALFTLGKIRNNKTRFIDIFVTSLIARIPFYFAPFLNWNDTILLESDRLLKQMQTVQPGMLPSFEDVNLVKLMLFSFVSILLLAYFIYLLYKGYKVATNAKGAVEVVLFGVIIIIAEIFSKIIFNFIN